MFEVVTVEVLYLQSDAKCGLAEYQALAFPEHEAGAIR
jgi:hypothetical protein